MSSWQDDLNWGLGAFGLKIPERIDVESWALSLRNTPCTNNFATVAASSVLFYLAERGKNPKVNDIYDAMIYCSTCLSVGYGDIFARTPAGKIIGTVLMTLGPALSGFALDGRAAPPPQDEHNVQEEILATLKQILEKL